MLLSSWCSTGFFWKVENNVFVLLVVLNLQTVFPLKPIFSNGPSFFVLFGCKHGALHLRLHVVALPASVTMSWPAKLTSKMNMSVLDFLVLVLQRSNSFDLNAFLSNFVLFNSYSLRVPCSIDVFEVLVFHWVFWKVENKVSVLFFCLKSSNCFPLKTHVFGSSFIFCTFLFAMMGLLWICACTCLPCQRNWACHDQSRLHRSWTCQDLTS